MQIRVITEDTQFVSPYALAKVAGVKPQMVYNYVRQGFIESTKGQNGEILIARADANAWLVRRAQAKAVSYVHTEVIDTEAPVEATETPAEA
jgi:hypothetical protein